jgi:hypothetical protein
MLNIGNPCGQVGMALKFLIFSLLTIFFYLQRLLSSNHIVLCIALIFFAKLLDKKSIVKKAEIYFSKNADIQFKEEILHHAWYKQVNNMGKYLGANISPGRTTMGKFDSIIDKIQNKLSGWKQQCLSFAGRLTLSKSVLTSIPYYHIHYANLPKTLCNEMEKIQRRFLWGDTDQTRKPHLVGWDVCCLPKNEGGLGIKRPHNMNNSFLMKMFWDLINKPDDLWCKVLCSKFGRNKDLRVTINSQPNDSLFWKALLGIWERFQQNIVWQLGDGNNINFWLAKWSPSGTSLISITNQTYIDTTISVRDVVTPGILES